MLHEGTSSTPADGLCVTANDKGLDKVFDMHKIGGILPFYCSAKHKTSEDTEILRVRKMQHLKFRLDDFSKITPKWNVLRLLFCRIYGRHRYEKAGRRPWQSSDACIAASFFVLHSSHMVSSEARGYLIPRGLPVCLKFSAGSVHILIWAAPLQILHINEHWNILLK